MSVLPAIQIIAEAGVNHDGELDKAFALIDAAADAGADAVKFQTFRPELLVAAHTVKADYQIRQTGGDEGQLAMLRRLALSDDQHHRLVEHCRQRAIVFLSTPFDLDSLHFLIDGLGLDILKISSGTLLNAPLLLAAARSGCRVILSTGMATLDEVRDALGVLAFGYLGGTAPSRAAFAESFTDTAGQQALRQHVSVLHCTTDYPAALADVNLRAMDTLAQAFGLTVGYSDHTCGVTVPIAAAARGARIIEKHFTLDSRAPGPDHAASLEPDTLAAMVTAIREVELALGQPDKQPTAAEQRIAGVARQSLVAVRPIMRGEKFTAGNLGVKRPGGGLSPLDYYDILGQTATHDYAADDLIAP